MWKNVLKSQADHVTIWRMHIAYQIPKATDTHTEYVILIALPLQQWLRERTSMLSYTYIACLVCYLASQRRWIVVRALNCMHQNGRHAWSTYC